MNGAPGASVPAPQEPIFLYPGIIKQIKVDRARRSGLIDFDDGGQGWVFLYSLCPLKIERGQQVQGRRHRSVLYTPAEVVEVNDEEICVRYDDGTSEWTTFVTLRVPCVANGPPASPTQNAPWQPSIVADHPAGGAVPSWVWDHRDHHP